MLYPQYQISQSVCNELILKDITPVYSPSYVGGYGGINIEANLIIATTITFDFGADQVFKIDSDYNQTKPDLIIRASSIPVPMPPSYSGCGHCNGSFPIEYNNGYMIDFPSGCFHIRVETFSADSSTASGKKLEGAKIFKFISKCHQMKRYVDLVDKVTVPSPVGLYGGIPSDKRMQEVRVNLAFAKMKLDLVTENENCDCDCIGMSIKQIEAYLNGIQW